MDDLGKLKEQAQAAVDGASDPNGLELVRVDLLGKKGRITSLMKGLSGLDVEARKEQGAAFNRLKNDIAEAIEARKTALETAELDVRLAQEKIDVTLPSRPEMTADGRIHPISQTLDEVVAIFGEMGFSVAEGPDIEDDFHNFTALNIPPEHPARQMHDTFYLPGDAQGEPKVLRTHTSPVQVRTMQAGKPPFRIIAPGRTYRCDSDMTHTPMFHQVEGLVVDEKTHMGHLKGCITEFCRAYFEVDDLPLRFRPSFFPFTEPSAEVDIGCSRSGGELKIGAGGDWLEILGCGMVHPNVLTACGIDADKYQGFAFGVGIERIAMLKYGIPDLRTFFDADLRWLRHYGFLPLDVPSMVTGLSR
ncbi:MAG: phenylalanine--tRNA ligase subunit alpha [Rhodospirillaceae bacterium]|jgi:phenylalanyl-tRNA synthetase alpha chain|nr:phenylalanine--tRNA ligase subunit alpha [Rhodospirillaceae bacterium]MBT5373502.1 phenylalanine--tRNA ligase subunit alpha [Rhodospirillaceae bacterium]MBT5659553.1 phenylalanine--tRNA ligase subunit alpha [Rhodospirillaceae bacterium]MBT5751527.1 phenylalanine--tRNA ligase subunit alpha [Rhodospirillaceae bacterium]